MLNHCSRRDVVVEMAQWVIPDSGPSGRRGFDDASVLNHLEAEFGHGTHFEPVKMVESLRQDGLWDRFLRLPTSSFVSAIADHRPKQGWRRPWRVLTWATRAIAVVVTFTIVAPIMIVVAGLRFVITGTA